MNPQDEIAPDQLVTKITITAEMDLDQVWHVHCPEWKFHGTSKNLTREIALLVADIECSVDEWHLNEPMWWKADEKLKQTILGIRNHAEEQMFKVLGSLTGRRKRRKPAPDDGKRTPRVSLWQAGT